MKFLTNISLWKKISALTAFGLAIGVGVFSIIGMRAVNQATEAMLQDRLTTAHLVADYVDEALVRALGASNYYVSTLHISEEQDNILPRIQLLEAEFSQLSIHSCGIYIVREDGQVIFSETSLPQAHSIDVPRYPEVIQAIKTGEPTISGLVTEVGTGTPVVFITSPINQEIQGGRCALVVAVDLARSSIGGFVRPLRLGQTGYVELVDQGGVVIARTEPGPKLAPFEKSDHSGRFTELINAGKPARGICHTCHEPEQKVQSRDVLAFVPLSEARWGVVVRQSEVEALAPTNDLRQNLLLFGMALVAVALLFVVVTTRDVGSRIKTLTNASKRIAEGDLVSPVSDLGRDEVGTLAHTFNDMRGKLKTSYGNLEQKTKELTSLLSVSEIMTSALDLPSLLTAVVNKAAEIIPGADAGALLLEKEDRSGLAVQCAVGLERESLSRILSASPAGVSSVPLTGVTEEEGGKIVKEAIDLLLSSDALRLRVQSYISADVLYRNHCIGCLLMVSFHDTKAFSESASRLLHAIADDIVIASEKAHLVKEADEARALHEADKLRSQFISSVSHELRTPLTLIKGYATSLLRQNVSWDKKSQREFLEIIDAKTDELRELIDKLLQSAKLEAGALKIQPEPVLIPRLARKVVEESLPRARKHSFSLDFPSSFPVVEADSRCLEQVIRNFVENAVKYSPEGGSVVVAGAVRDSEVVVSISDEGIGIPQQCQDKIFERFYRVDNPLTRGTPGCGLGLSICKGHVEAHGGRVWLESTANKGSKFFFTLPMSRLEDGKEQVAAEPRGTR